MSKVPGITLRLDQSTNERILIKAKNLNVSRTKFIELCVRDALLRECSFLVTDMTLLTGDIDVLAQKLKDGQAVSEEDIAKVKMGVNRVWRSLKW